MESSVEIPEKLRKLPVIPFLGIYLKKCTCTPMFIAALFTIAKIWKQPRCPTTDEWSKKHDI
jgi:hypothetical protein